MSVTHCKCLLTLLIREHYSILQLRNYPRRGDNGKLLNMIDAILALIRTIFQLFAFLT